MQAKIMMLLSDEKNKRLCRCTETVLYEVAGSFGHSFSIRYDQIGRVSFAAYEAELTEETIENCEKCDAVLADDAHAPGMDLLLDELQIDLMFTHLGNPRGLKLAKEYELWCAIIRSLDADSVHHSGKIAFDTAAKMLCPVSHVAPNGKNRQVWDDEIRAVSMMYPHCVHQALDPDEAIRMLIQTPEQLGILLCPPYAGKILQSAAETLCGTPYCMHVLMLGRNHRVFAPCYPSVKDQKVLSPVAMIMALSSMLRLSLNLEKEADCVDAAVQNVLEAGWRTPDMTIVNEDQVITPEDLVDLICEQISLAGQLIYGGAVGS